MTDFVHDALRARRLMIQKWKKKMMICEERPEWNAFGDCNPSSFVGNAFRCRNE